MSVKLNEVQGMAAHHIDGAVLVTAGAGSGKTRLLTQRIVQMVNEGVSPYNILCITFTNKAANEMKERLVSEMPEAGRMWILTFHSMCARLLREHIDRLGYGKNFNIYSENDKERVLKRIVADVINNKELVDKYLKNALFFISEIKNKNISPEDFENDFSYVKDLQTYIKIINLYQDELKKSNALDFDDLILQTYKILRNFPEVLDKLQERFKYISVDEFQDTNKLQYQLVKLLASKYKNIFVVGDEDQSIYGWRGASIQNIFDFKNDFGAVVYKLEQNYRSTQTILAAANNIIKNNGNRLEKKLWTDNETGELIEKYTAVDEVAESAFVVNKINSLVKNDGYRYSDFAILTRVNALTRPFEEKLMYYNIPYAVFGGFKFFERKEIKDILAYLRLINNTQDNESLIRIINFPKRGIGDTTVAQIRTVALENDVSMFECVMDMENSACFSKAVINKVKPFADLIKSLMDYSKTVDIKNLLTYLLDKSGIKSYFSDGSEESMERLLNIDELIQSVDEYMLSNTDAGLSAYLENVALISDIDNMGEDNQSVSIATIHSAKGLEFKVVFLVGMDEQIFPLSKVDNNPSELEEERRLMYVAVTRARTRLYMTRANSRFMYGERKYTLESRFWKEIESSNPNIKISIENSKPSLYSQSTYGYGKSYSEDNYGNKSYGLGNDYNSYGNKNFGSTGGYGNSNFTSSSEKQVNSAKTNASRDPRLSVVGTKVSHKSFGEGRIISASGDGDAAMISVNFLTVGKKTLALAYAPLEIID